MEVIVDLIFVFFYIYSFLLLWLLIFLSCRSVAQGRRDTAHADGMDRHGCACVVDRTKESILSNYYGDSTGLTLSFPFHC